MQLSLRALIAHRVHLVCNGFLPHSLLPSLLNLHPLTCPGASPLSSSTLGFGPLLARDMDSSQLGGIWWPRGHTFWRMLHLSFQVHPDSDHCSLGTWVPPHLEASSDPETRVLGLTLTNCCSTPLQPSSPLGDQMSMSHAELAHNAAHSLPYCTLSSLGVQWLVLALGEVFSSLTQPLSFASHDEFHTLPTGFSLPTLSARLRDILQIT